ncbi:hypothetical protein B0H13DRAFT_1903521 [Mycena leptocephala]|nr:hypothetical protein B0H13DRAFT_1903521 [Mycena leptocephala]
MAPASTTDIFDPAVERGSLGATFEAFNAQHEVIKRVDRHTFRVSFPGLGSELISAHTIRFWAEYSVALHTREGIPVHAPAFYANFAEQMNAHDDSGFGWAFVDEEAGIIVFNDKLSPADPASFFVEDRHIFDRLLGEDEVAVSRLYFENAERLLKIDQQREVKYFNDRQNKRKAKAPVLHEVHTKEAKEFSARKRKALEEAAAATKKQKTSGGEMQQD